MQKINEAEKEFRFGDWGAKYIFRGPHIDWGIIVLKPDTSLKPHFHNEVEETFYFLKGSAKIIIGTKEFRVKQGDAFRIEAKESHDIINDTQEDVKAIMLKFPYLPDDKVDLE